LEKRTTINQSEMALLYECMPMCAQKRAWHCRHC